jgi:hypothetical protein
MGLVLLVAEEREQGREMDEGLLIAETRKKWHVGEMALKERDG